MVEKLFFSKAFILLCFISIASINCKPAETKQEKMKAEEISTSPKYYNEDHRPQFHFSPHKNWMNDPNGMVYFDGNYHLFYQYYPDGNKWGPMHWGHAISQNLVNWEHLPIALYPDEHGLIFSGSAVVDWNNSTGFGKNGETPLVAIFTYHNLEAEKAGTSDYETQGIAYSLDKGFNWIKYEQNPVIQNQGSKDFRDPKVHWNEKFQKWIMVIAVKDHVEFYGSTNLIEWEKLSDFGKDAGSHEGVWECPDLFTLKDEEGKEHWVLIVNMNPGNPNGGSGTQYFIGTFDGKEFSLESNFEKFMDAEVNPTKGSVWLDSGTDNYAGITWSDIPKEDGRKIFLGWMSNWAYAQVVPTEKWRSAMTLPLELNLHTVNQVPRLMAYPVDELDELHGDNSMVFTEVNNMYMPDSGLADVNLICKLDNKNTFGFKLSNQMGENVQCYFDKKTNSFYFNRMDSGKSDFADSFKGIHEVKRLSNSNELKIRALIDRSSIEVFFDDGKNMFTELYFPHERYDKFEIITDQKEDPTIQGSITELKQIWRTD